MTPNGFWRMFRGLLAALLVFGFAAAPVLDSLVCADEAPAAEALHADVAQGGDEPSEGLDPHGEEACHHGHCHHGGSLIASAGAPAGAPFSRRLEHGPADLAIPASDRQFGLIRPPRA